MTTETRTLIEFKDVLGVEYECGNCGTKIQFPLKAHDCPLVCPNCNNQWFAQPQDTDRQALVGAAVWWVRAIAAMEHLQSAGPKLKARIEIAAHSPNVS